MNRDQKAAVVGEVATQIQEADAVLVIDYRGLSVTQAVDLRARLEEADATFRVVKNRLTSRAAEKAGAQSLKELLQGPTAFTFVRGDLAPVAKTLASFRHEHRVLEFKGGTIDGETLSVEQIETIARLPGREALQGQLVGVMASPLTGLARGLGSLLQGVAVQLAKIQEQGLVGGQAPGEHPDSPQPPEADHAEAGAGEPQTEGAPAEAAETDTEEVAEDQAQGEAPTGASTEQHDASDEAEKEE
jgi:large subunit ribosomal protein L10